MKKKFGYDIMIADDHIVLRDALSRFIDASPGWNVTGVAADGEELLSIIQTNNIPDVILLDLNMPVMDGYETAEKLKEIYPTIKVTVLSMYDADIALIRLLRLGVRGFLKKNVQPDELIHALNVVASDDFYYVNNTIAKLSKAFGDSRSDIAKIQKSMFTDREIEFLKLVTTEMTYKEIAAEMNLTTRAAESIRDDLFNKVDVNSRIGLAMYAVRNGVISF